MKNANLIITYAMLIIVGGMYLIELNLKQSKQ